MFFLVPLVGLLGIGGLATLGGYHFIMRKELDENPRSSTLLGSIQTGEFFTWWFGKANQRKDVIYHKKEACDIVPDLTATASKLIGGVQPKTTMTNEELFKLAHDEEADAPKAPGLYALGLNDHETFIKTGQLICRSARYNKLMDQKAIWAKMAKPGGGAVIIGAFEAAEVEFLTSGKNFRCSILVDLWDSPLATVSHYKRTYIRMAACRFVSDAIVLIKGHQVSVAPKIVDLFNDRKIPITFVSVEADYDPSVYIATALILFAAMADDGIMVLNCSDWGSKIENWPGCETRAGLYASMRFVLAILRGQYAVVHCYEKPKYYVAIRKTQGQKRVGWNEVHPVIVPPF
jgi:hypothetical protein